MDNKILRGQLEATLFAAGDTVSEKLICERLDMEPEDLRDILDELEKDYEENQRGIRLLRLDGDLQLCSAPDCAEAVRTVLQKTKPQKLSAAAMEVLSVVAYFQPVTKVYIEQLRGIDCSRILSQLTDRGLIEEAGRMSVPGRPILYRTTSRFLRVFGVSSIDQLPKLERITKEDVREENMTMEELSEQ